MNLLIGIAMGGMEKAQTSLEQVAGRLAKGTLGPADSTQPKADTLDLSAEMVALIQARNQFQSNARGLQTAGDMQKTLLNLLA